MWQVIYNITKKWWDRHKGHGLDRTSVPVWPNVRQKKKTFRQLWNSPDIHKAQCCNKSFDISYHWHWTSIIFMTGYRHFHLKKGKVKQGFIYENAQKKVLENCNFLSWKVLEKSLICSTKKCMNPVPATAILFYFQHVSLIYKILLSLVIFLSKRDSITIVFKSFDFSVDSFAFSTKICLFLSFPQMVMALLKSNSDSKPSLILVIWY